VNVTNWEETALNDAKFDNDISDESKIHARSLARDAARKGALSYERNNSERILNATKICKVKLLFHPRQVIYMLDTESEEFILDLFTIVQTKFKLKILIRQFRRYLKDIREIRFDELPINPVDFWKKKHKGYELRNAAEYYLAMCISSAAVERSFSALTRIASDKLKSRMGPIRTSHEFLCSANRVNLQNIDPLFLNDVIGTAGDIKSSPKVGAKRKIL